MKKRIVLWAAVLISIAACTSGCAEKTQKPCAKAPAIEQVIVFAREGVFCGWPANNGVWIWDGKEILVGFSHNTFKEKKGHNSTLPGRNVLARSLNGGKTWKLEDPDNFVGDDGTVTPSPGGINFAHPDFAMRVRNGQFYMSLDRGRSWQGPYLMGSFTQETADSWERTSRTDYLVNGRKDCFIFMSARPAGFGSDRAFCIRTTDGGATFNFQGWIVPPSDLYRGVMPATVRCSPTKLVSALRRRDMTDKSRDAWVDVYVSHDNGANWKFLSKVGDTGGWNGNPPALVRLKDARLCCVYGNRSKKAILARYSSDDGKTWEREIVLRDDFQVDSFDDPDLGYPRLVQRADGRLVCMYYWATKEHPHHHIAATIWDPDKVK
jgi:hypothetical protein